MNYDEMIQQHYNDLLAGAEDWAIHQVIDKVLEMENENAKLHEEKQWLRETLSDEAKNYFDMAQVRLPELLRENAALREAALFLLNEIDGEAFHQVGQANGEMLYEGVSKLRDVINATKKESGDDAIMRQHLNQGGTPT